MAKDPLLLKEISLSTNHQHVAKNKITKLLYAYSHWLTYHSQEWGPQVPIHPTLLVDRNLKIFPNPYLFVKGVIWPLHLLAVTSQYLSFKLFEIEIEGLQATHVANGTWYLT